MACHTKALRWSGLHSGLSIRVARKVIRGRLWGQITGFRVNAILAMSTRPYHQKRFFVLLFSGFGDGLGNLFLLLFPAAARIALIALH